MLLGRRRFSPKGRLTSFAARCALLRTSLKLIFLKWSMDQACQIQMTLRHRASATFDTVGEGEPAVRVLDRLLTSDHADPRHRTDGPN